MPEAARPNPTSELTLAAQSATADDVPAVPPRRVRTIDLITTEAEGRRWAMLTSCDQYTAVRVMKEAGVHAVKFGGGTRMASRSRAFPEPERSFD